MDLDYRHYDKFHIMRHLSKALDEVRRSEYKRLSGRPGYARCLP